MKHKDLKRSDKGQTSSLQKIDTIIVGRGTSADVVEFYRVFDGVPDDISAQIYDDLIVNNFNED